MASFRTLIEDVATVDALQAEETPARVSLEDLARQYAGEIVRAQEEGPYFLGGWSFGGAVAFELARLLAARAEEVARVVAFDAFLPGGPRMSPPEETDLDVLIDLIERERDAGGWPSPDRRDELERLLDACGLDRSLVEADADSALRHVRLVARHRRAFWEYEPGFYDGEVTVVLAREGVVEEVDGVVERWADLASSLEVVEVPGTHLTLMDEPNVRQVAAAVRERLRAPVGHAST